MRYMQILTVLSKNKNTEAALMAAIKLIEKSEKTSNEL